MQQLQQGGSAPASLPFRRLSFVPARNPSAHSVTPSHELVPLNSEMPSMLPVPAAHAAAVALTAPVKVANTMADANAAFCNENAIQLSWNSPRKAGSGLVNLGNTCFMNAVLQCLTHTPPLAELCLRDAVLSTSAAERQDKDPIVAMQAHIKRALSAPNAVQPLWHARNLKTINRRFRLGRQEDAHEYLRCVLDAMHEAFLKHIKPKPPPELAATTFMHRIFGGKLRSEIVCEGVEYRSATFDPFLDLSLEITKANSLTRALKHFTAEEVLDGDNRYRCPKNNKLVRAYKRISIENAPNVLTVHLKRFDFFGRGHKISRKVDFDMQLDLGPFMTAHLQRRHHHHHTQHKHQHTKQQQQHLPAGQKQHQHQHHHHHSHHNHHHHTCHSGDHQPLLYDLYAVLVHHGHSLHSGHYVSFVKAGNGIWHHCDDHRVAQVSERMVEGQQAYILFYVRRQPKGSKVAPAAAGVAGIKGQASATFAQAAASAAVAAANAANREQQRALQREQLRQQKQQDSSRPAGAGASQGAGAGAPGSSAALQEVGSASAADAHRTIATSSTESTANASPGTEGDAKQQASTVDFTPPLKSFKLQYLQNAHNHHTHFTRSRALFALSSFDRHLQYAKTAAAAAAAAQRLKRRNSSRQLAVLSSGLNGFTSHGKEQHKGHHLGLLGGSPSKQQHGIRMLPVSTGGAERQQQQQQQSQEKMPEDLRLGKRQRQQAGPLLAAGNPDLPLQHMKRPRHKDGGSSRHAHQHDVQQQQPQPAAEPQQQRQQQQPQPAGTPSAYVSPAKQQHRQQQSLPRGDTVLGAAALELLMSASRSEQGRSAAAGWDGGDAAVEAQAAALQRAAAQQSRRKARDEWDVEYDRGKQKKVRSKSGAAVEPGNEEPGPGVNRFQQAWQEQLPQKARQEAWKGSGPDQRGRGGPGRGRGGRFHSGRGNSRGGFRAGGGRHSSGRGGRGSSRGRFSGRGQGGSRGGRGFHN